MAVKKASNSTWKPWLAWTLRLVLILSEVGSGLGAYTFYRFYVQKTGVTLISTGKDLSRAKLVDLLIMQAVQKGQQK